MTSFILIDGEFLPITPSMILWADHNLKKEAERIDKEDKKSPLKT